ncbi:MAG: IS1634 family transposase [Tissierellia bacterium]|nr:IS1634 family transposase [Tissierellia bacterium]
MVKYYSQAKLVNKDVERNENGGYLFLQQIYHKLKIDEICENINTKYSHKYDLNEIMKSLIYTRIIYPSSKLKSYELSASFIEKPNYNIDDLYRALDLINKEDDYIQAALYKNSLKYTKRNDKILFYDCTNFYFEIEEDDDFRKYGKSKENRPNPLVGMGLFMDGDGIPLAFSTFPGNTNEQITLKPLEKQIIKDFELSRFVVSTDAGLSSTTNRRFNDISDRAFITTQSLKQTKKFIKNWALDLSSGWRLPGSNKYYDISSFKRASEIDDSLINNTYYKERWIKENDIEQRIIVTFSPKYMFYQQKIRNEQVNRAIKVIERNPKTIETRNQNDPKRFIKSVAITEDGVVAEETHHHIDQSVIDKESVYDGLYAVCTNLEDDVEKIIEINKRRWQIEDLFRLMKTEFKSRPVYLSKEERIKAHFTTCFLAVTLFRFLEKKLNHKYTHSEIISTLRNYNFLNDNGDYIPTYKRTDITDYMHDTFGFRTDYEINSERNIKKIIAGTKKQ